ncbi:hypothetical protein NLX86_17980 [Streptomyces sp. A3M-1-3]|uniref:hypothetical protein n=1 Tax=Streptomyces sp. A3M-1-3 TaxID=2962044 RepID=UPI0020B64D38|nr:hypothetical protein [Streptomyces sp. A3M-1-3]MCP3819916.1 hypothetical protein [Streptomyces sp. A3M-1-3]
MSRSSSGFVAGLTAAALAVVGFLAYQASANAPALPVKAKPSTSASAEASTPPKGKGKAGSTAVPADSGTGVRVVYSLSAKRVWLVGEAGRPVTTFEVMPSTVSPEPGSYKVTSRTGKTTGSDGVPVEHVVRFANVDSVPVGFSAAVDGSVPTPDPGRKTGGIRMAQRGGDAMWRFATINSKVVVVP